MSRFTLAKDFRNIDAKLARIILIEAGPRILQMFSEARHSGATRDLETLGVQVWASCRVTNIDATVFPGAREFGPQPSFGLLEWKQASTIGRQVSADIDRQGRVIVEADLSVKQHPNVFVIGDMAHAADQGGKPLPGYSACCNAAGPVRRQHYSA